MEEKQKSNEKTFKSETDRKILIGRIINLRKELNLPTDDHMIEFITNAHEHEVRAVWEGLLELMKIFKSLGNRTFASNQA